MQSGKILAKNLKTLIAGRSSRLGSALSTNLIKNGSLVYSVDQRIPLELKINKVSNEQFIQGNLAEETFFQNYLKKVGPIDAFVNCAAVRKSYNYFLSYLLSRSLMDKMKENEINEYGCRGCIINLVHLSSQYDDKYFSEQDEFAKKYNIDSEKIDDQVFQLADMLTAARIRCNTIMVNDESDPKIFSNLVTHIIEDQYVAGQIINMEDNLKHNTKSLEEVMGDLHNFPKPKAVEEKYVSPKEIKVKPLSALPKNSV